MCLLPQATAPLSGEYPGYIFKDNFLLHGCPAHILDACDCIFAPLLRFYFCNAVNNMTIMKVCYTQIKMSVDKLPRVHVMCFAHFYSASKLVGVVWDSVKTYIWCGNLCMPIDSLWRSKLCVFGRHLVSW